MCITGVFAVGLVSGFFLIRQLPNSGFGQFALGGIILIPQHTQNITGNSKLRR
ncbi:MAG: hypothetical protein PWQ09_1516 [Candidatus Cloacimonadota bacterium]|jgi:hypothetical protein|nr:hypothetical protein [Candidatus Cloacimonadota bacterium]